MLHGWLALSLLTIGLVAHSPQSHEHLHGEDCHEPSHACAVTLAAIGFVDTAATPPDLRAPEAPLNPLACEPVLFRWPTPTYWLIPTHAPPAA